VSSAIRLEDWTYERGERERQEIRRRLIGSLIGHAVFLVLLFGLPSWSPAPLPAVVSIDLLAAMPSPAPSAPRAAPKVTPPATPPPAAPAVVPPAPVQKKKVLPREAPKPRAKPVLKRSPKPPQLDYDDVLASMRDELGEPTPSAEPVLDSPPAPAGGSGRVDPVLAAWLVSVERAVRHSWVTPAQYRNSDLRTSLVVTLMADGRVLGEPEIARSSGDPHFDDNAVRAVMQASPLPPPPQAGDWPFLFNPTD